VRGFSLPAPRSTSLAPSLFLPSSLVHPLVHPLPARFKFVLTLLSIFRYCSKGQESGSSVFCLLTCSTLIVALQLAVLQRIRERQSSLCCSSFLCPFALKIRPHSGFLLFLLVPSLKGIQEDLHSSVLGGEFLIVTLYLMGLGQTRFS
jgi:hypothetical protein